MSPRGGTVVVVGSINVDRSARLAGLPAPGQTVEGSGLRVGPGGKGANQAVAAARLGASVRLLAAIGEDPGGEAVLASLAAEGVDVSGVRRLSGVQTGEALILVDDAGENCIVVIPGANGQLTAEALDQGALEDAGVMVLCLEVPDDVVLEAARRARAAGVPVLLNVSPVRQVSTELLNCVDVLVVNEHELGELTSRTDPWVRRAAHLVDAYRVDTVVVTLGARGAAWFHRGDAAGHEPGLDVPVADTTGCGDAFLGALAHELVLGAPVREAVRRAVAAGAAAATRHGTQESYPTRREVDALLAEIRERRSAGAEARRGDPST